MRYTVLIGLTLSAALLTVGAPQADDLTFFGSNQLEYSWEQETRNEELIDFLDLDLRYRNLVVGGRLEIYQPDRPSLGFERVATRYVEYSAGWLRTRVGDYYSTFGRGVVLRSFDNEELRRFATPKSAPENTYDTGLDGLKCDAHWGAVGLTLLTGRRERENELGYDVLHGGDVEVETCVSNTRIGASVVRGRVFTTGGDEEEWLVGGGRVATFVGPANVHAEYARHVRHPWTDDEDWGNALYVGSNVFLYGVGASLEFKDYRAADFPYSSPPTCNRSGKPLIHDVTRERDERGWQAEFSWSPLLGLGLVANHSFAETEDGAGLLKETFVEGRWDLEGKGAIEANWERLEDNLKVENGPTVEMTYYINPSVTVTVSGEREWNSEWQGYRTYERWVEDTAVLSLELVPTVTVTTTFEHTTSPIETHKNWLFCQLGFHLTDGHEVSLAYGRQRGGLKCSSGVCRVEPEFEGARLSLILRL
jgi:hypothetical protein